MARADGKLATYRAKRDFDITAEPSGTLAAAAGHRFVIQQHAARRMHYDFRLELDGVLLSWSVPKGPSLSPKVRRLAVRTEDHPLDYIGFEGIIPKGQYGGGTVSVWDRGTWRPEPGVDARAAIAAGKLAFTLDGEKLRGRWHLVRTKPQGKQETWLLFKGRDELADDSVDIIATRPASVISGRTLEQIANAPGAVWNGTPPQSADLNAMLEAMNLGFSLTNLDKVLYPDQGITKAQLIGYFAVVAPWMLPHAGHRPLMVVRCPDGSKRPCFFQKHALKGAPPAIERVAITEHGGDSERYMAVSDLAGLVALAQLGTLEVHTWGARTDKIERPDLMVFDLDPDTELAWDRIALAALEVKRLLHELGFTSFVKTTGGKGLHVVVPVARRTPWPELKAFTKAIAERLAREQPNAYTTNLAKAHRKGRIFVDYLRNGRGATFIAPYSPRARPGAPIATPISWDELAAGIKPAAFTLRTLPARLEALERDPWDGIWKLDQAITAAVRKRLAA